MKNVRDESLYGEFHNFRHELTHQLHTDSGNLFAPIMQAAAFLAFVIRLSTFILTKTHSPKRSSDVTVYTGLKVRNFTDFVLFLCGKDT